MIDKSSSHIIVFDESGKVLLLKRAENDEWEPGKWSLPGGGRKDGETLLQNIVRETKEETGLSIYPKKIWFLPTVSKKINHIFFTTNRFSGDVKLDHENSDFKWINPKEINEKESVPNLKEEISEAILLMSKTIKIKIKESMRERKDILPGGLGDESEMKDFDKDQVVMGISVEMEHTNNPTIALEVALDHLTEDPQYYTKLKTIEKHK